MENQNQNMSAEQDADLRRLEAMAAAGEPDIAEGSKVGGEVSEPVVDQAESWAMVPAIVGSTLAIAFPELQRVYTPEACRNWGAAMAPVAEKYGWSADGLVGPEIGLFAASLPFIVGTVQAVRLHRAEMAKNSGEKPEKPAVVPEVVTPVEMPEKPSEGKTVTFGAPSVEAAPAGKQAGKRKAA